MLVILGSSVHDMFRPRPGPAECGWHSSLHLRFLQFASKVWVSKCCKCKCTTASTSSTTNTTFYIKFTSFYTLFYFTIDFQLLRVFNFVQGTWPGASPSDISVAYNTLFATSLAQTSAHSDSPEVLTAYVTYMIPICLYDT